MKLMRSIVAMTVEQILETLPHLSFDDRNKVIDKLAEIIQAESISTKEQRSQKLAVEAIRAYEEYQNDPELTIFTCLDGEDFYEYSDEDFEQLDQHE